MISIRADHLKRYKEIVSLLVKYGRSDLAHSLRGGIPDLGESAGEAKQGAGRPEEFARDLEKMEPTFIKLGQLLSTQTAFLPEAYILSLEDLQDKVEPFPFEEVERIFPGKLNDFMELALNNGIRVKVDALDETRLIGGLQKIANRITMGLVLASLVIGAALMMRVDTPFRILGYPGLAMMLFFGAGIGGLAQIWSILRHDEKTDRHRLA